MPKIPPSRARSGRGTGPFLRRCALVTLSALVASVLPAADGRATATAEWRQEAEAFTTKTTGAQFSDANASGGAAWNLWTNGHLQTSFSTTTTGAKQIDVVARGNVAAGVWPIMQVVVDGTLYSEETVASSTYRTYSTTIPALTAGSHTLRIGFTNDAIVGTEDRNLKVDVASVVPSGLAEWTQQAEAFPARVPTSAGAQSSDGSASGGAYWNQWANGYIETTLTAATSGTKQINVVARGQVAVGIWPNMRITVDGQVLGNQTVGTTTWQPYTITTTLSKGAHTLRIQFTNDATVGSEDRNLKVDVASLIPVAHEWKQEAEAFAVKTQGQSTSSSLASAGYFWNLWSNGNISTTLIAASSGRKEIRFVARGAPAAGVFPIVKVWLGATVLSTLTVSSTTFSTYTVPVTTTAGTHTLMIEFTNDATINGEDRNVHLDVATLVGDNAFPFVQGIPSPASNSYVGARPQLRATYADPDGDAGYVDFEVYTDPAGALVTSGRSARTEAGAVASWNVPVTLDEAQRYRWRARAYDGTSYAGAWTANQFFTVDTLPPPPPSVSSTTYPSGSWSGANGQAGQFTFSPGGSGDVVGYKYGLDVSPPATDTTGTSVTLSPAEGRRHLYVQSVDRAGNLSPVTDYAFNVGGGAITSPRAGDTTAKRFSLLAVANPVFTGITYQWRRAVIDAWADIPTTHFTNGPSSWPLALAGGTHSVPLDWNVVSTVGGLDGPFEVRAVLTGPSSTSTSPTRVTLDQRTSDAATAMVGMGEVNLLTGNLGLSVTDVSVESFGSDLLVSRAHNSRDPGVEPAGPFGPGWTSSLSVPSAGAEYTKLTASGSLRTVTVSDGSTIGFTATSATDFVPEEDVNGLTLRRTAGAGTPDQSDDVYVLSDLDNNEVEFTWLSPAYVPTRVTEPGDELTTTYTYQVSGGVGRIVRALAPVPAGVTCGTPTTTRGCRSLGFDYSPSSTPVPGDTPATWGDYSGRLRSISLTAWHPDTGLMTTVGLAAYSYDSAGRLRASWDPRLPALKTTYSYDGSGHVTTVTPAGEEPWSFSYAALPDDPDGGRLRAASRPVPGTGTATWTVVYDVPVAGTGAPYDLSATQTARWGQTDKPTDATAVFPPSQLPDDNPALGTLPTSYERATVHYLDVNGNAVNTAQPGGHIVTAEYDEHGNAVRGLSASNRRRALDSLPGDTPAEEAAIAQRLSLQRIYDADGSRVLEEFGPEQDVTLGGPVTDSRGRSWAAGSMVRARAHLVHSYDEGAPAGTGPYDLVTTTREGARLTDTSTDADVRVTRWTYDWDLGKPTTQTVDPDGLALTTRWTYDGPGGQLSRWTRQGGTAAENTAHTTVLTYWTAGPHPTHSDCGGRPEWANLVCRDDPAAQPTVDTARPALPSHHFTYDMFGRLSSRTDKNGTTTLRTWTTQSDSAGRPWRTSVSATVGQPLPTVESYYDPTNGKLAETRTIDGTGSVTARVVRTYDTLGRITSYTDADGNTSTTTYDLLSRPVVRTDGKGSTTTYYDEGSERRGLPGRMVDTVAGTFSATYDADGHLATHDYPNGLRASFGRDELGRATRLTYTKTTNCLTACEWLNFAVTHSVHGERVASTGKGLSAQLHEYDAAGRLVKTSDSPAGSGCTTRTYGLDADSNRSSSVTWQPTSEGGCDITTAGSTTVSTYDEAARLTTDGYVYDVLGRTVTVPAVDAHGKSLTATYYVNDLARSLSPQDGTTTTWELDPSQQRFRSWTEAGVTRVNHYSDDTDSPSWIAEGGGAWTRYVRGLDGVVVATQSSAGVSLLLVNLHGDVVGTSGNAGGETAPTATYDATEFGSSRDDVARRYGWLGAAQRSADAPSGVVLMGVRLYNTSTGRFLQPDPVAGGSANPYDYAGHDPVNGLDLDGRKSAKSLAKDLWNALRAGSMSDVNAAALAFAQSRQVGATCKWRREYGLWVCTGAKAGFRRGGTIYGQVFITSHRSVDDRTLRHENRHANQYFFFTAVTRNQWLGFAAFWTTWIVAEAISCVTKKVNLLERWAGPGGGTDPYKCFSG